MTAPAALERGPLDLHASAVVVGEAGVLLRGRSGAGKSRLALALVAEARRDGLFARIVADDRTLVTPYGERLVARAHPALAGLVERRGLGIVPVAHEPACVLALVVDLVDGWPPRMPAPEERRCNLGNMVLPRLALAAAAPAAEGAGLVLAVLAACTAAA